MNSNEKDLEDCLDKEFKRMIMDDEKLNVLQTNNKNKELNEMQM